MMSLGYLRCSDNVNIAPTANNAGQSIQLFHTLKDDIVTSVKKENQVALDQPLPGALFPKLLTILNTRMKHTAWIEGGTDLALLSLIPGLYDTVLKLCEYPCFSDVLKKSHIGIILSNSNWMVGSPFSQILNYADMH